MKNENYKSSCSVVVKRSPAVSGRKSNKTISASSINGTLIVNNLGKSVSKNINAIDKTLNESRKIIPLDKSNSLIKA